MLYILYILDIISFCLFVQKVESAKNGLINQQNNIIIQIQQKTKRNEVNKMITINSENKVYQDIKLENIIGFAISNGYFLIDEDEQYLISFWEGDITCKVESLSNYGIFMDSTLGDLISEFKICDIQDVVQVFTDEEDFTLNLMW